MSNIKKIGILTSGGDCAGLNAVIMSVVNAASQQGWEIYGIHDGTDGLTNRPLSYEILTESNFSCSPWPRLAGSYLGSLNTGVKESQEVLAKRFGEGVRELGLDAVLVVGGDGSMNIVSTYCKMAGVKMIGIPKTIDNDLCETDHSPGFGSAAKYVCSTVQEITRDSNVYCIPSVTIIETMGRHAGWLAASSCCIRANGENAPHLIYLPEMTFSIEKFLSDVKKEMKKHKAVIVVVSEGVKTAEGKFAAEEFQSGQKDVFGHSYLAGIGKFLEKLVAAEIGCKVRSIELNVMQRCSSHIASREDIESSAAIGSAAVEAAISGKSGCMMTFIRESDKPYRFRIETVDASKAANSEKLFPREWINEEGNNILPAALDYFMPLIQGEILPIMKNGMPLHMIIE